MFCGPGNHAHVLEIAQYADKLLENKRQVICPVVTRNGRSSFDKGSRSSEVVVTAEEIQRQGLRCYN